MPSAFTPPSFAGKAVSVCCTDLRRSERFYVETLGAAPLPTDGPGCRWYQLGALTLSLVPNAASRNPAEYGEHATSTLWLEVDDIQAAYRHLVDADCTILQSPDDDMLMLIADPDGLVLEIWQRDADP